MFTARTGSGDSRSLPGDRASGLLFFSVSCGSGGAAARALGEVQAADPGAADFAVVDVAAHETSADIQRFLRANDAANLAYAADTDGALFTRYFITSLSTLIIVANDQVTYRGIDATANTPRDELAKATRT